jgi:hypothetical protein
MSLANAIPRNLHFGTKSMSSVEMTGIGGGMVSGAADRYDARDVIAAGTLEV